MSAAAILSHKRVQAYGCAAKESLDNPGDLKRLGQTAELLIAEAWGATTLAASALDDFKEEIRQHQGGYVATRKHLEATFHAARWALSQLSSLILYVQSEDVHLPNVDLHQKTFDRMKQLQEDFYEMLVDIDDEKLQKRMSDAFAASPKGTGEPSDWRNLVFGEEPRH